MMMMIMMMMIIIIIIMIIIIIPQKKIVTSRHSKYSNQVYTITYALPLCAHPSPRLPPTPQQGHHRSLQDILVTLAHLPAAFPGMFIPISLYTLPILTFTEDILLYFLSVCKIALFSTNFLGCDSKLHSKHHHQYFRVYCGTNESLSLSLFISIGCLSIPGDSNKILYCISLSSFTDDRHDQMGGEICVFFLPLYT